MIDLLDRRRIGECVKAIVAAHEQRSPCTVPVGNERQPALDRLDPARIGEELIRELEADGWEITRRRP